MGNFENDLRSGFGILVEKDGSRYKGEWKKNKRNGEGKQMLHNGDTLWGTFKDDEIHGHIEIQ